jgi:hypothetical protein
VDGHAALILVCRALDEREHALFGGGDVKSHLPELNAAMEQEQYRRLLPGYIRRFVETAAPLIDLRLEGDADGIVVPVSLCSVTGWPN